MKITQIIGPIAADVTNVQLMDAVKKLSKEDLPVIENEVIDPVIGEWRSYCKIFADKAAKLKKESSRDTLRYEMEKLLFEAARTEKQKEKEKKKKKCGQNGI